MTYGLAWPYTFPRGLWKKVERSPEYYESGYAVVALQGDLGRCSAAAFLDSLSMEQLARFRARFRSYCRERGRPNNFLMFEALDCTGAILQVMTPTHQVQGFVHDRTLYLVRGEKRKDPQVRSITIEQVAEARQRFLARHTWRE